MAKTLNRSAVYLSGVLRRFELPAAEGATYSDAQFHLLRTLIYLRTLNVSEEALLELWRLEKKLLQLLHADSSGSPTWFLDECGRTTNPKRRLLLSNYDIGVELPGKALQLGLNFSGAVPELFAGADLGEDALRVLAEYLRLYSRIRADIAAEHQQLREAIKWSTHLP